MTALVWGMVVLSALPYRLPAADAGLLRLSWRAPARGEESCRTRTQEAPDALQPHMQTPEVCERAVLGYDVSVEIDGTVEWSGRLEGRGARGDRPIAFLHEVALSPGRHEVTVSVTATAEGGTPPPPTSLEVPLTVEPARVYLVTVDPDSGRLRLGASENGA
jgi:hypothetical protein